jgi:hypothetical protein
LSDAASLGDARGALTSGLTHAERSSLSPGKRHAIRCARRPGLIDLAAHVRE